MHGTILCRDCMNTNSIYYDFIQMQVENFP